MSLILTPRFDAALISALGSFGGVADLANALIGEVHERDVKWPS